MTEEIKTITADVRFAIKQEAGLYREMRNAIQSLNVNWASETLLSPPSPNREMVVAVKLVATDRDQLNAAHESLKKFAKVQTFEVPSDSTTNAGQPAGRDRPRRRNGTPAFRR
jgi:putative lipoic acid-binding regulatory protein